MWWYCLPFWGHNVKVRLLWTWEDIALWKMFTLFKGRGWGWFMCLISVTCITIDILSVVIHLFYNIRPHILQCSLSGYHNNTVSIYCLLWRRHAWQINVSLYIYSCDWDKVLLSVKDIWSNDFYLLLYSVLKTIPFSVEKMSTQGLIFQQLNSAVQKKPQSQTTF